MVKALVFKGDKKLKKRKRELPDNDTDDATGQARGAPSNALVSAEDAGGHDDESWVTARSIDEIAGPIIIILPTKPATCLASDANGKIFASELENLIDGQAGTAEPHDVRQVWVANRVAGSENFSLRGHHGRYLGCDKFGLLSAVKEAISPEESFLVVSAPDDPAMFGLQTRDKYITTTSGESSAQIDVRGDATVIDLHSTFRIRSQARFIPRLKVSKEEKVREKISRSQLEEAVGRRLDDEEVKRLKKARREGNYHEALLDVKVKGKHDKFA